jgi:hypothetical protein
MMADLLKFEPGQKPWKPSRNTELVETFLYNNMPLVGVIRQHGTLYLFRCVEGFADETHVWAYVPVEEENLDKLRRSDELWMPLQDLTSGQSFMVAIATDRDGIVAIYNLGHEVPSILDSDLIVELVLYGDRQGFLLGPGYETKARRALSDLNDTLSSA